MEEFVFNQSMCVWHIDVMLGLPNFLRRPAGEENFNSY